MLSDIKWSVVDYSNTDIILQVTLTHELGYLITDSSTSWGSVLLIREIKRTVKLELALNFPCWSLCKRALAQGAEAFVPTSPAGEILTG